MNAEIVKHDGNVIQFNREQVDLIKRTVMPGDATDDELKLFMHVARASGLDPLRRQIHCTKRNGKLTLIAGIDGLRARAAREPDFEGLLHGVVCAKDVVEFDATTGTVVKHIHNPFADRGAIIGAWATVIRKGKLPFTANVKFSEFAQMQSPTWKQMPAVMIDKVAQSTALRMAYPEQFSAIYEQAEMDQSEPSATVTGAATAALKAKLLAVPVIEAEVSRPEPEVAYDEPPPDEVPFDDDMSEPPQEEARAEMSWPWDAKDGRGTQKGTPISSWPIKDLTYMLGYSKRTADDPSKAQYRESNLKMLEAVKAEMQRRKS